jgi:hypothetical protein
MQEPLADHASLTEDPLVAALTDNDTMEPADVTVLHGFLGKSPTPGRWRLYPDRELTARVELHEADIVRSQSLSEEEGTILWVRRTARVQYVQAYAQEVPADLVMPRAFRRPQSARLGRGTVEAGAIPFAIATPHHARRTTLPDKHPSEDPKPSWADPPPPKYPVTKYREDRYRPGPYGFLWEDEPETGDPNRAQY